MNKASLLHLSITVAITGVPLLMTAAELPTAPSEVDYGPLKQASPFGRVLSLSETYALRGIAAFGDLQVITLYNRTTEKTLIATTGEANEEGIRLVSVVPAPVLEGVAARIALADEEIELKYEESQLAPQPRPVNTGDGKSNGDKKEQPRGPTPEERARYEALPEDKKTKLREYIGSVMRNYPDMSREERGNLIRGAMSRLSDGHDINVTPQGDGNQPAPQPPQPQNRESQNRDAPRR